MSGRIRTTCRFVGCINALIGLDFVVSGTLLSRQWGFRRRLPGYQPWQCAPLLRPQTPDSHTANIAPRRELVDFPKDWRGWVEEENKERSSRKPCKFNCGHGTVSAEAIVSTCIAIVKIARRLLGVIQSLSTDWRRPKGLQEPEVDPPE